MKSGLDWKDLQDSKVLEARKVVLADGRQVVAVQITEKHQREEKVREQEANHGRDFGQQE